MAPSPEARTSGVLFEMRMHRRIAAALPADAVPRTPAEAYRAQAALIDRVLADAGGRAIGYKVAATNPSAQTLLKVDAPFFGVLLSATTFLGPAVLPAADFTVRCLEPEFGFEMAADVPPADRAYTRETIANYIAAVVPCIEIVDHRYEDWAAVGAESLIADNAIHGAWVEAAPVAGWPLADLDRHAVTLSVNGTAVRTGTGAAVLGHPLNVVAWLANELPRFGRSLRKGDKISTGIVAPVYLAAPGDTAVADFGALGRVELSFTAAAGA